MLILVTFAGPLVRSAPKFIDSESNDQSPNKFTGHKQKPRGQFNEELNQDLLYILEAPKPVPVATPVGGLLKAPIILSPESTINLVSFHRPSLNFEPNLWTIFHARNSLSRQRPKDTPITTIASPTTNNNESRNASKQSQEFDTGRPITSVIGLVTEMISGALLNGTFLPPFPGNNNTIPAIISSIITSSPTTTSTTSSVTSTPVTEPVTSSTSTPSTDPVASLSSTTTTTTETPDIVKDPNGPVGTETIRSGNSVMCGEANPSGQSNKRLTHRIIGGHKTEPGEFPFQVRLNIRSKRGSGVCGGVIYDDYHILTAAHCMTSCASQQLVTATIEKSGVHATIGDHAIKSEDGETDIEIDDIKPHEKYDACNFYSNDHDIAIIKTQQRINYRFTSDGYGSINRPCIPNGPNSVEYREGEPVIVSGWGVTRENSGSLSNILRYVQVPIVNVTRCQETYGTRVTQQHVCAGFESGGMDSCQGDSGGPLVRVVDNRYELVGIVSFGYGCGLPGAPGVYTRVASYTDWIKSNL